MKQVEYRDIPGMPGYIVGDDGSVWSQWKSRGRCGHVIDANIRRRLKHKVDKRGYHWVRPMVSGRYFDRKVGRLVLEAFVGPMPSGNVVRHLNDVKDDNRLENLAYGTVSDNAEDARRNGKLCEGERHGVSKYTESQVREVRRLREIGYTLNQIAEITGVKRCSVWQMCNRSQWRSVQ